MSEAKVTTITEDLTFTGPVDIVKLYNPANAGSLTESQLADMQKLTSEQIKQLAEAYPNKTMQRAYLLIIDSTKPISKQLPNLNSFENLWNLREKNGQRKYVAFGFKGNYKPRTVTVRPKKSEVMDLSDTELMSLPGFKTGNGDMKGMTVEVSKVVRKVKDKEPDTVADQTTVETQTNP